MHKCSAKFYICPEKREKWIAQIANALEMGHLDARDAAKLAGRLSFANQNLFRKLGRAMIKAVYTQASTKTGLMNPRLREALRWWLRVLNLNITEECMLAKVHERGICRLFVDAASTPAHCAAVLFIDGHVLYTDAAPSSEIIGQLAMRNDKQITSLVNCSCHIMSFALSLCLSRAGNSEYLSGVGHLCGRARIAKSNNIL